jgi:hypothetical protein
MPCIKGSVTVATRCLCLKKELYIENEIEVRQRIQDFSRCITLKKSGFVVRYCEELISVYKVRFTLLTKTAPSIWFL